MKNLTFIYLSALLLATVFVFSSCKKDKDTVPDPNPDNNKPLGLK